jgi:dienelactone hydrolase
MTMRQLPTTGRGVVLIGAGAAEAQRMGARGYIITALAATDVDAGLAALAAAMAELRADPATRGIIAVAGFGAGGALAFLAATRLGADAVATLWGAGIGAYLAESQRVRVPLSMHFADDDERVPVAEVRAIKGALEGFGTTEIYRYKQHDTRAEEDAERRACAVIESVNAP